jgi:hypothetical protein
MLIVVQKHAETGIVSVSIATEADSLQAKVIFTSREFAKFAAHVDIANVATRGYVGEVEIVS